MTSTLSLTEPHQRAVNNLLDLKCTLLTGNPHGNESLNDLYDNAFLLWKQTWENVIFPNGFISDYFFNANTILVLHKNLEIAAVAIYNFYDLKCLVHQYAAYLNGYRDLNILKPNDSFMTIEYICASPNWRGKNHQFGKVLVGLSQEVFKASTADYVFGTARIDHGIDKVGPGYGYKNYGEINRYGLHCALMVNSKKTMQQYPEPEIVSLTDKLWATTQQTIFQNNHQHAA